VDGSSEAKFNEASAQLSEGLKTCRTVVDDYRGLLKAVATDLNEDDPAQKPEDDSFAQAPPQIASGTKIEPSL